MIPPVVASDRGTAQTAHVAMHARGSRTAPWHAEDEEKVLERTVREGDNPVSEVRCSLAES